MMLVRDADKAVIGGAVERLVYGKGSIPQPYNSEVVTDIGAREVYSYGRHFPLFRFVPRRRRVRVDNDWITVDSRRPPLFVINGDRWPGSRTRTPDHQNDAREAIARTGLASIVIPFSALDGAGIDIDSIVPLDVTADAQWTETVERRTLKEIPLWARYWNEAVERTAPTLDRVPANSQTVWRELTPAEKAEDRYRYAHTHSYAPILPGPDGLYHWKEYVKRETQPDADGLYRYEVSRHRLGGSLFSAERRIVEPDRPAAPFEAEIESRRLTVRLAGGNGRHCNGPGYRHEAGPGGSCIHCAQPLTATVSYPRRGRYLSSFDYNEPGPLYFLCEVSRAGVPTVDGALDSLAPPAIHAAILAGREVRRQGDVFFIDTALDTATLAARGAVFGRFTQWSRGAKARAGEVTYRPPNRERDKAVAVRELKYARRLWRDEWRAMQARAESGGARDAGADADARERNRELWRELTARHALQRADADARGVPYDAGYGVRCEVCGADIGEPCRRLPDDLEPATLAGRLCGQDRYREGSTVEGSQRSERNTLAREGRRERTIPPAPYSRPGSRAAWRTFRDRHAGELETARANLRRATLAMPARAAYAASGGRLWNETPSAHRRRAYLAGVVAARKRLDALTATGPVDSNGNRNRAHARDSYRARFGTNAVALWSRARDAAQRKYRPETVADADAARRNREAVRAHLAIYGTAHTASEVARVGGAVYVRGTVRHAVELESGRRGGPDHIPLTLTADRWYLAVRNTVPRQNRRKRRSASGATGQTDRGNV